MSARGDVHGGSQVIAFLTLAIWLPCLLLASMCGTS